MCAGSGKTAIVTELARLTGNADLLSVHVDDQMDAKSVVGAYVTTAVPGEFAWAAGPLTQVSLASTLLFALGCLLLIGLIHQSPAAPLQHPCSRLGVKASLSFRHFQLETRHACSCVHASVDHIPA